MKDNAAADLASSSMDGVTERMARKDLPLMADMFGPGYVLMDRYRLKYEIGRGGMGAVIEVHDEHADRELALKVLLPHLIDNEEAVQRFVREARVLDALGGRNVCQLWDIGTLDNGAPFMVMDRLRGRDLATVLEQERVLPVATALDYVLQACHAVAAAHKVGIIHRDLKPENLFVADDADGEECVKVLDFGLSKLIDSKLEPRTRKLTAESQIMGTPCYMAPEQWQGGGKVVAASDQWALAVILYELLAGTPPFSGRTIGEVCAKVLNQSPPSLLRWRPRLKRGLNVVLRKALEKEPQHRYRDLTAFAVALSAFLPRGAPTQISWMGVPGPVDMPESQSDMYTTVPRVDEVIRPPQLVHAKDVAEAVAAELDAEAEGATERIRRTPVEDELSLQADGSRRRSLWVVAAALLITITLAVISSQPPEPVSRAQTAIPWTMADDHVASARAAELAASQPKPAPADKPKPRPKPRVRPHPRRVPPPISHDDPMQLDKR